MIEHHLQTFSSVSGQQLNTAQSVTAYLSSKKKKQVVPVTASLIFSTCWFRAGPSEEMAPPVRVTISKKNQTTFVYTPSFYFLIHGHTVSFVVLFSVIGHLITAAFVWTPSLLQPSEAGLQQS